MGGGEERAGTSNWKSKPLSGEGKGETGQEFVTSSGQLGSNHSQCKCEHDEVGQCH